MNIIERFGEPSKMDIAPYRTICKVISTAKSTVDIYAQISNNEEEPVWNYIATFDANITQEAIQKEINALFSC